MEVNGLPLHPLLVHAVVVLVPLGALVAGAFAVLPRWRRLLRWPTVVLAVVALVLVQVAMMSGNDLQEARGLNTPQVADHEDWAELLRIATAALAVLAVPAAWLLPRRAVRGGDGASALLTVPVAVLLVLAAVAVLVLAFLTGEAGARAVWGTG